MTVEDLSPEVVRRFLDHLEQERHCSGTTRNQRLGATIRWRALLACARHSISRGVRSYDQSLDHRERANDGGSSPPGRHG